MGLEQWVMSQINPFNVGQSGEVQRLLNAVRMVGVTAAPVMLRGENGSGKELLARHIHAQSPRKSHPFVALRCMGLEEAGLQEAIRDAMHGTLFLNGVEELSSEAQKALLGGLEKRLRDRDVRVISSSCADPDILLGQGDFRPDLYYQLNVVSLDVPPLRERRGDIVLLLKEFSKAYGRHYGRKAPRYAVSARNLIKSYKWPGNLRELQNFAERMVILMPGATITAENLPPEFRAQPEKRGSAGFQLPVEGIDLFAFEQNLIRQALELAGGNKSKAARMLGITRDTLLYRIRKYALQLNE